MIKDKGVRRRDESFCPRVVKWIGRECFSRNRAHSSNRPLDRFLCLSADGSSSPVSLGLPCAGHAQCHSSDPRSACIGGVCVCAAFADAHRAGNVDLVEARTKDRNPRNHEWICAHPKTSFCPKGTFQVKRRNTVGNS